MLWNATLVLFAVLTQADAGNEALAEERTEAVEGVAEEGGTTTPVAEPASTESDAPTSSDELVAAASDVVDLDIQDILNLPVVTASKRAERLSRSPAIISVITREDIESFAPLALDERLSYLAGIETMETFYGYTSVTFRGITQPNYNNRSLFLINGHPLFAPAEFSFQLEQAPELAIERVEVVRGPGSVLYGTNAYAGVINVITRKPTAEGFANVRLTGGSLWTNQLSLAAGKSFGDLSIYLFGTHNDSRGYAFKPKVDEEGRRALAPQATEDFFAYENDYDNLYFGATYKTLTVNAGYFTEKKDKWGLVPASVSTGPRYLHGWLVDADYRLQLGDKHELAVLARHDGQEKHELVNKYPPASAAPGQAVKQHWLAHKSGAELQYSGLLLDDALAILAGAGLDYYRTEPYEFRYTEDVFGPGGELVGGRGDPWEAASAILETYDFFDYYGFLNLDYTLFERIKISAGGRLTYNSDYGAFIAPRGALVVDILDEVSAKVLYGRAYRAPSFFEKYVQTGNVLYGGDVQYIGYDDVLTPEVIDTVDGALELRMKNFVVRATGYLQMLRDGIGRENVVPADAIGAGNPAANRAPAPAYRNSEFTAQIYGVELDGELRLARDLRLVGNGTYRTGTQKVKDPTTDETVSEDLTYYAPYLLNLGLTYRFLQRFSASLFGQVIGPRAMDTVPVGPVASRHVEIGAYALLNARLACDVSDGVRLALSAKNLTDTRYRYPEYIRRRVAAVPGGPGATFFGTLELSL